MTVCVEVQITYFHQDFGAPEVPFELKCYLSQQLQGPTWLQLFPTFHPTAGTFACLNCMWGPNFGQAPISRLMDYF